MSSDSAATPEHPSRLLAYLRLFRLPNVFTAIADVAMGYFFVSGSLHDWGSLLLLAAASCLLYTAGMVLNDVYDFDIDAKDRPFRPLPSGQISLARARLLGYGMLAVGVGLAFAAGAMAVTRPVLTFRSGMVAVCLATCVVVYDAVLKKTVFGPLAMGGCRFFNVLLGMSIGAVGGWHPLLFEPTYFMVAGGIGVYIAGVTWFARTEAKAESSRGMLIFGVAVMAVGVMLLAFFPRYATLPGLEYRLESTMVWPLALFLMTVSILRRCLAAVGDPSPERVQAAVKQCIFSLIVLDAAVVLLVAHWAFAIAVLALLVPTFVLGKWVYST
jgi:4-hydroxybenzoate polyprenyltransferase